jgi:hypothetical protein
MFLGVDDVKPGMILNWQSEHYPEKKSRWIVLEQLSPAVIEINGCGRDNQLRFSSWKHSPIHRSLTNLKIISFFC